MIRSLLGARWRGEAFRITLIWLVYSDSPSPHHTLIGLYMSTFFTLTSSEVKIVDITGWFVNNNLNGHRVKCFLPLKITKTDGDQFSPDITVPQVSTIARNINLTLCGGLWCPFSLALFDNAH